MTGRAFYNPLIPEFSGAVMDVPMVERLETVEIVHRPSSMDRVEPLRPLRLPGGAFGVYRQLSQEQ